MSAPRKAFPSPPAKDANGTPKPRQFKIGEGGKKQLVGYKLSSDIPERVLLKAIELQRVAGQKVWPAHVMEAAWIAFEKLDPADQQGFLEEVQK